MDVTKFNKALVSCIELISDVRLETMKVTSNEQGLFIEGNFRDIMNIVRALSNIDKVTSDSIFNYYTMCVDFEEPYISFLKKEKCDD